MHTHEPCVRPLAQAALVLLLSAAPALGQFEARTADEFAGATLMQKRQALGQLAMHRGVATSAEAEEVVRAALADPATEIREAALYAVSARIRAAARSPELIHAWRSESKWLTGFRGTVVRLLVDPDAKVRVAAMHALCSMDFDPHRRVPEPTTLSYATVTSLAQVYSQDRMPVVRAHAVTLLGGTPTDDKSRPLVDTTLLKALEDPEAEVVQSAATGLGRRRAIAALPRLVTLLSDNRTQVRLRTVQALAAFGSLAKPYLADLEAALARESDEMTKKTLEAVVQTLR